MMWCDDKDGRCKQKAKDERPSIESFTKRIVYRIVLQLPVVEQTKQYKNSYRTTEFLKV